MSRKMVLVPESMLLELKGKLPKSPEFQAAIGLGQQLDQIDFSITIYSFDFSIKIYSFGY